MHHESTLNILYHYTLVLAIYPTMQCFASDECTVQLYDTTPVSDGSKCTCYVGNSESGNNFRHSAGVPTHSNKPFP